MVKLTVSPSLISPLALPVMSMLEAASAALTMSSAVILESRVTTGAGSEVSSVKLNEPVAEVLPAVSVCFTCTLFTPSTAVKLEVQVAPLSILYSTVAPASIPATVKLPSAVMLSVLLLPVSLLRLTSGALSAWISLKAASLPDTAMPAWLMRSPLVYVPLLSAPRRTPDGLPEVSSVSTFIV